MRELYTDLEYSKKRCSFGIHPKAVRTMREVAGGIGSAVLKLLEQKGLADSVRIVRMGVSDEIVNHGDPKILLAHYGLDADGIASKVVESLDMLDENQVSNPRIKAVK